MSTGYPMPPEGPRFRDPPSRPDLPKPCAFHERHLDGENVKGSAQELVMTGIGAYGISAAASGFWIRVHPAHMLRRKAAEGAYLYWLYDSIDVEGQLVNHYLHENRP